MTHRTDARNIQTTYTYDALNRVQGKRLRECTRLVNQVEGRAIAQIFGYPDDIKFRSSMTLFASVRGTYEIRVPY